MAEGFAGHHNAEYRQFLYVSLGSLAELTTQVTIAEKLGYVDKKQADDLVDETDQISKMTMSLIKKLA
ncbi:MAG: four helix bundle protein [Planctomycetota bacterium]|jgi:four helix bundle protein